MEYIIPTWLIALAVIAAIVVLVIIAFAAILVIRLREH